MAQMGAAMTTHTTTGSRHIHIPHWTQRYGMGAFLVIILLGAAYSISELTSDLVEAPLGSTNITVFILLGVADRAGLRVRQRLP